ncbi:MAG: DUF169 domain-containing protein [ANME-2 cluster archaeon]|nr:DUF169 domain-containing protein [ANME-2 cluster archaeon]
MRKYKNFIELMDNGFPVGIKFSQKPENYTNKLRFCELVQKAREGESITFSQQACPVGSYVLGRDAPSPDEYYLNSGRYKNKEAAILAAEALTRLDEQYSSIQLFPVTDETNVFKIMLLFLTPQKAMRLIQALSYHDGRSLHFSSSGTASVCGECIAGPAITSNLCISMGCKGSRKHSKYGDDEVIVGIPQNLINDIQEGLKAIPGTFD